MKRYLDLNDRAFNAIQNKTINCKIKEINKYKSVEELLILEGTKYTLSSTDNYEEGIKSINSLNGYEKSIK